MSQIPGSHDVCLLGDQCALCWWRRVSQRLKPLTDADIRRMFRWERERGD